MYRLGHQSTKHYVLYASMLLAIGLVVAVVFFFPSIFQSHTMITQAPPVTHHVAADTQQPQHITKSVFTLDLPGSWLAVTPPAVPYTVYSWAGKAGTADNARRLDVYIDKLPAGMAVNRLLPVQAAQDRIDIIGATSDNCVSFTDRASTSAQTDSATSKWSGVNFICDVGNYERDVVATGSTEGVNMVTPVGATAGARHVLLIYTDNSANPDYSIFVSIVKSFRII